MKIRLIVVAIVVLGCTNILFAPVPAPAPITMPGKMIGTISAHWIGPNVSATKRPDGVSVTWFDANGKVKDAVANVQTLEPGFIIVERDGHAIVRGVNRDWQMELPNKHTSEGYITGTTDSRYFVQQFEPHEGEISADIYADGKLLGSIGPYVNYLGNEVELGDDGSIALLTWKTKDERTAQIVAIGPAGKETFRVDWDGSVRNAVPAPGAAGVLVQPNDARGGFIFYDAKGRCAMPGPGPNGRFVAWVPGTMTALMETSVSYDASWQLIDWQAGKPIWKIDHPTPAPTDWSTTSVAITKDYVLMAEHEMVQRCPVRTMYALDLKTGKVVAHWLPKPRGYPTTDSQTLLKLGEHVYLVADSECSEIKLDDIAAHRGGWE